MARVSNWARNPQGYHTAKLVGAYPETKFNRDDTAIAVQRTEGDKVFRLEIVLTAAEVAELRKQLNRGY